MVTNDNLYAAYPPELIDRVASLAERDAGLTAEFLGAVGLAPPPGEACRLPARVLLELGAAMRLLAWEEEGLDCRRAGLPIARDAILRVFREATDLLRDPSGPAPTLGRDVFGFTVDHLAWAGPKDLRAEILLDFPDEDALVEVMARFLWDNRANGSIGERRTDT